MKYLRTDSVDSLITPLWQAGRESPDPNHSPRLGAHTTGNSPQISAMLSDVAGECGGEGSACFRWEGIRIWEKSRWTFICDFT